MLRTFVYTFISSSLFLLFFYFIYTSISRSKFVYVWLFIISLGLFSLPTKNMYPYVISFSSPDSTHLWSIPLPSPQHSLKRLLSYPKYISEFFRVNVRISAGFSGQSRLYFSINGGAPSPLTYAGFISSFKFPEPNYYIQEGRFSSDSVPYGYPIEVKVWQPVPDPLLRIVVWADSSGASYVDKSSWFGYNDQWFVGAPSALTGLPTSGFPMIWIDNFD
jgi:hypothetical protein